jgi:hypothetical protein
MSLKPTYEYQIENKRSQLRISVKGDSTSKNKRLVQGKSSETDKWLLQEITDGEYYRIVNVASNLVISVKNSSNDDNAELVQVPWSGANHQQWKIETRKDDYVRIKNKSNGKYIMVKDGSKDEEASIVLHKNVDDKNGRKYWKLKTVNESFAAGDWIIGVTGGRYLSKNSKNGIPTASTKPNHQSRIQLIFVERMDSGKRKAHIRYSDKNQYLTYDGKNFIISDFKPSDEKAWIIIDEDDYNFSIRNQDKQYMHYHHASKQFEFRNHGDRTIFNLTFRILDKHINPDSLQAGEVALFTDENYDGTAYVVHGELSDLGIFKDLGIDDSTQSMRVGDNTYTRFYAKKEYDGDYDETGESLDSLKDTNVKSDTITSIKAFVASEMPYKGYWAIQRWSSAVFNIFNKNSMLSLHVEDGSDDNKAAINQDDWNDKTSQEWLIESIGDNYYRIINQHSKKVLQVANSSLEDGAKIQQSDWKGKGRQKWKLELQVGGYYAIINEKSGKALTVEDADTHKKANIIQETTTYSDEQLWLLSPQNSYLKGGSAGDDMNTDEHIHSNTELRIIEHKAYDTGVQEVYIYYPKSQRYLGIDDNRLRWQKGTVKFLLHEEDNRLFSLQDPNTEQWVIYNADKDIFELGSSSDREILQLAVKIATNHEDTGTLENGEVAFFEYEKFKGKNWIFYQNFNHVNGIPNIKAKSMRLGIHTAVTVFYHHHYHGSTKEFTQDMESMTKDSFKFDKIGALVTGSIELAEDAGVKILNALSEDYKNDGDAGTYSNYRTTIQFPANVTSVQIHATAKTTIHFGDSTTYTVDPVKVKTVNIGNTKQLTINMTAENISVPALLIRTDTMPANEYFPIYPDQDGHSQIAGMKDDQLWDHKDDGKHIVDKDKYSKKEVGDVQKSITQLASAIKYTPDKSSIGKHHQQKIDHDAMKDKHWQLLFGDNVEYQPISSYDEAMAINNEADELAFYSNDTLAQWFGSDLWDKIKKSAESLTKVVVHKVEDIAKDVTKTLVATFHYIEDGVVKAFQFVIEAAKYVGQMIETILEKIAVAIEDFIKMLRFLFEWDDIRHTQLILEDTIDASLDFAMDNIDIAKEKADEYLKKVTKEIDASFDTMIKHYSKNASTEPSDDQNSMIEKVHWFLSMIQNGGNHNTTDGSISSSHFSDISNPFSELAQIAKDCFDDKEVNQAFNDIANEFGKDISHIPSWDDVIVLFLKTFKGLSDVFMKFLTEMTDALFDMVKSLIEALKNLLDYKITNIPILSDLYKKVIGDDLSFKSLISLFFAIPATVIAKAIDDKHPPFKNIKKVPAIQAKSAKARGVDDDVKEFLLDFNSFIVPVGGIITGFTSAINDFAGGISSLTNNVNTKNSSLISEAATSPLTTFLGKMNTCISSVFWISGFTQRAWNHDSTWKEWTLAGMGAIGPLMSVSSYGYDYFKGDNGGASNNENSIWTTGDIKLVVNSVLGTIKIGLDIAIAIDAANQDKDNKTQIIIGGVSNALGHTTGALQFLNISEIVVNTEGISTVVLSGLDIFLGLATNIESLVVNAPNLLGGKDDD